MEYRLPKLLCGSTGNYILSAVPYTAQVNYNIVLARVYTLQPAPRNKIQLAIKL